MGSRSTLLQVKAIIPHRSSESWHVEGRTENVYSTSVNRITSSVKTGPPTIHSVDRQNVIGRIPYGRIDFKQIEGILH